MIGELVRRVVDVDAWAREAADLRALLARRISPVSEADRIETCAQLAEASARTSALEGEVDSLLRRLEAAATRENARLLLERERAEAARDRVGEALARVGAAPVRERGGEVGAAAAWGCSHAPACRTPEDCGRLGAVLSRVETAEMALALLQAERATDVAHARAEVEARLRQTAAANHAAPREISEGAAVDMGIAAVAARARQEPGLVERLVTSPGVRSVTIWRCPGGTWGVRVNDRGPANNNLDAAEVPATLARLAGLGE
jgi:hypothetical protein